MFAGRCAKQSGGNPAQPRPGARYPTRLPRAGFMSEVAPTISQTTSDKTALTSTRSGTPPR